MGGSPTWIVYKYTTQASYIISSFVVSRSSNHYLAYGNCSFIQVIKPTCTINFVFSCSMAILFSLVHVLGISISLYSAIFSFTFVGFWVGCLVSFKPSVLLWCQRGIRAEVNFSLPISLLIKVLILVYFMLIDFVVGVWNKE